MVGWLVGWLVEQVATGVEIEGQTEDPMERPNPYGSYGSEGVDVQFPWEGVPAPHHKHTMAIAQFHLHKTPVTRSHYHLYCTVLYCAYLLASSLLRTGSSARLCMMIACLKRLVVCHAWCVGRLLPFSGNYHAESYTIVPFE